MSRRAPRPLSLALDGFTDALAPATTLARVQQAWEQAVGAMIAEAGSPDGRARWRAHDRLRRRGMGRRARFDELRARGAP